MKKKLNNYDIYFIYAMNKLIKQFMNKFKFVQKLNKKNLNKLSKYSIISSSSNLTHVELITSTKKNKDSVYNFNIFLLKK